MTAHQPAGPAPHRHDAPVPQGAWLLAAAGSCAAGLALAMRVLVGG